MREKLVTLRDVTGKWTVTSLTVRFSGNPHLLDFCHCCNILPQTQWLKTHTCYLTVQIKASTGLCSFLEALGKNFSCLFQLLKAVHILGSWPLLHLQIQQCCISLTLLSSLHLPKAYSSDTSGRGSLLYGTVWLDWGHLDNPAYPPHLHSPIAVRQRFWGWGWTSLTSLGVSSAYHAPLSTLVCRGQKYNGEGTKWLPGILKSYLSQS